MESRVQPNAQEPEIVPKVKEKVKKLKKEKFSWWQSFIILVATLVICLSAGYYVSSKYLWNQGDKQLEEQLKYYKVAVDQKPNDPKTRIQLGYTYFLKGDIDSAIKEYKTAKSLDKNNYDAYLNLSIAYDEQKRTDESLQMAIKAAKLAPRDYKGHFMKGKEYRELKMYKEATESLQEALRLKPGSTDILYEVGLVAEKQNKKEEAEQIYKETLSYDPTYKPALKALERLKNK